MQKHLHFKDLFTFELLDYFLLILNVLLGVVSIVPYGKLEIFSEHVCIVKIKIIANCEIFFRSTQSDSVDPHFVNKTLKPLVT